MKPWIELTPEEKLSIVEAIADPGQSWAIRARLVYEMIRRQFAKS